MTLGDTEAPGLKVTKVLLTFLDSSLNTVVYMKPFFKFDSNVLVLTVNKKIHFLVNSAWL